MLILKLKHVILYNFNRIHLFKRQELSKSPEFSSHVIDNNIIDALIREN